MVIELLAYTVLAIGFMALVEAIWYDLNRNT